MEYSPTRDELLLLDSQLLHCVTVQDIDVAAAIYQDSGETGSPPLHCKGCSRTRAYEPGEGITSGWSALLQLIGFSDQCMNSGVLEATACTSCYCCRLLRLSSTTLVNTT